MKRSRRPRIRRSGGRARTAQTFSQQDASRRYLFGQDFIEGSAQDPPDHDDLRRLAEIDPHEAAARVQELLGYQRRALRIRQCGRPNNPASPYPGRRCNLRQCPTCSKIIAAKNGHKMADAIRRMTNPTLTLFSMIVPMWSSQDLKSALADFRAAFTEIRRKQCFAGVNGGIGAIETKVTEHGAFNLHAHLVLDLNHIDVADADATWRTLIQPRARTSERPRKQKLHPRRSGSFSIAADDVPKDIDALAIYSTKCSTWSPSPGNTDLPHIRSIQRAIWRRQLLIRWGSALPAKRA
jgi:hypothetical protein